MCPSVTIAHRRPCQAKKSSHEVTRGPQNVTPIDQTSNLHPIIEAQFECLKVGQEQHEQRLGEHDKWFEVHQRWMERQDTLIDQIGKILRTSKRRRLNISGIPMLHMGLSLLIVLGGTVTIEHQIGSRGSTCSNSLRCLTRSPEKGDNSKPRMQINSKDKHTIHHHNNK